MGRSFTDIHGIKQQKINFINGQNRYTAKVWTADALGTKLF
jgi:hypothetical protein